MIRKLAYYGDPILRKRAESVSEITDEILSLIDDMVDTMVEKNGIGIAAPQVQCSLRIFITHVPIEQPNNEWAPGVLHTFINPKIISVSEEDNLREEGCLSIPKVHGNVIRPTFVTVEALNRKGELFRLELSGLEARCVLHENDHLNGVLFPDRMNKKERKSLQKELQNVKKVYFQQSR